jgi:hypothetical protein
MPLVYAPIAEPPRETPVVTQVNFSMNVEAADVAIDQVIVKVSGLLSRLGEPLGDASGALRTDGLEPSLPDIDHALWANTVMQAREADDVEVPSISPFSA